MQLLILNEEFLVSASHQLVLNTSLPFVHTARRSYRLNDPVRPPDWGDAFGSPDATLREAVQTLLFRGRRSRNKVSVGEPAEGSLPVSIPNPVRTGPAGLGWASPRTWGGPASARPPRQRKPRLVGAGAPLVWGAGAGGGVVVVVVGCAGMCGRVRTARARVRSGGGGGPRRPLPPPSHPRLGAAAVRFSRAVGSRPPHKPNNNSCRRISWLPQR